MKFVYVLIGIIAFVLGIIGAVLPLLPTTPFLLFSAFCFTKGSQRLNAWLRSTSIYKNHMESFVEKRAMEKKAKIRVLTFASMMLMIAFLMMDNIYGRSFILLLIAFKFYYFYARVKTIGKEDASL